MDHKTPREAGVSVIIMIKFKRANKCGVQGSTHCYHDAGMEFGAEVFIKQSLERGILLNYQDKLRRRHNVWMC